MGVNGTAGPKGQPGPPGTDVCVHELNTGHSSACNGACPLCRESLHRTEKLVSMVTQEEKGPQAEL